MIPRKFVSILAVALIVYVLFFQKRMMTPATPVAPIADTGSAVNPAPAPASPVLSGQPPSGLMNIIQNMGMLTTISIDTQAGSGPAALCGQTVGIKYTAATADGKQFADSGEKPLTFRIGDHSVIKGLEQGVQGMKKGGSRKIQIPPKLGFDDAKFSAGAPVPASSSLSYDITLVDYAPSFPEPKGLGLRIYDDQSGAGDEIFCGDSGLVNYRIWDMEGNLIASNDATTPVKITTAEGKFPYAMELALAGDNLKKGMHPGGKRTVIAPPAFINTLSGKPANAALLGGAKLPNNKPVLIEVELVKVEK